jgi:hypothetical protein
LTRAGHIIVYVEYMEMRLRPGCCGRWQQLKESNISGGENAGKDTIHGHKAFWECEIPQHFANGTFALFCTEEASTDKFKRYFFFLSSLEVATILVEELSTLIRTIVIV